MKQPLLLQFDRSFIGVGNSERKVKLVPSSMGHAYHVAVQTQMSTTTCTVHVNICREYELFASLTHDCYKSKVFTCSRRVI
jgi:hypothetical protein